MASELGHVRDLFANFQRPWFIAGGWAIDLWLGRKTREHADIDIAVLRADQVPLRGFLRGWSFQFIKDRQRVDWIESNRVDLPFHEIHAFNPNSGQTLEVLLNESTERQWVYRRNFSVTCPLETMGRTTEHGIPFLNPAIVLLYKSKSPTEKDYHDFDAAVDLLDGPDREWLKNALKICHPQHAWLDRL